MFCNNQKVKLCILLRSETRGPEFYAASSDWYTVTCKLDSRHVTINLTGNLDCIGIVNLTQIRYFEPMYKVRIIKFYIMVIKYSLNITSRIDMAVKIYVAKRKSVTTHHIRPVNRPYFVLTYHRTDSWVGFNMGHQLRHVGTLTCCVL